MLHKLFDWLKVPYHQAMGEAEAECARLQQLGIVDAVWSDDGDSLMFGCTTLIRTHKIDGSIVKDHIRVYRAGTILQTLDMDATSLVLFTTLTGGDYDTKGLPGCGPQKAKQIARRSEGLAQALSYCNGQKDLQTWRIQLSQALGMEVHRDFPNLKALEGYRNPKMTSDQRLRNLRKLQMQGGWDGEDTVRRIDQEKLRSYLRDHYDFCTRQFIKHIAPIFLVRRLARSVTEARRQENLSYNVELRPMRPKKAQDGENAPTRSEVNVKYEPAFLLEIDLSEKPQQEAEARWRENDGSVYDPTQSINDSILECFVRHGLPAHQQPVLAKRKNAKLTSEEDNSRETPHTTPRGTQLPDPQGSSQSSRAREEAQSNSVRSREAGSSTPKKRARSAKDPEARQGKSKKTKASKKSDDTAREPSPELARPILKRLELPTFTPRATVAPRGPSAVIDLCEHSETEDETLARSSGLFVSPESTPNRRSIGASQGLTEPPAFCGETSGRRLATGQSYGASWLTTPSRTSQAATSASMAPGRATDPKSLPATVTSEMPLKPGEAIPLATLRELRAAALAKSCAQNEPLQTSSAPQHLNPTVIDLT